MAQGLLRITPRRRVRSRVVRAKPRPATLPAWPTGDFATAVKRMRHLLDLNRSAFCDLVGITRTTLRALEAGTQHPTGTTLRKFEKVFGTIRDSDGGPVEPALWKGLRPEDLRHAQRFHHAPPAAKYSANTLLGPELSDDRREQIAAVLVDLLRLDADDIRDVAGFIDDLGAPQAPPTAVDAPAPRQKHHRRKA